jgi:hypothetical protein
MREILREWELGLIRHIACGVGVTPDPGEIKKVCRTVCGHKRATEVTLRRHKIRMRIAPLGSFR